MSPEPAVTQLVIYASALHQAAWQALLTDQPTLVITATVADEGRLAAVPQSDQTTTILIDLLVPQLEVVKLLKERRPRWGLLVLVQTYDLAEIIALLKAGATGCLSRDATVSDLARAIIAAGRSEIVLPPSIATQALLALARGEPLEAGPIEPFTDREVDVLRLLGQGLTNKDIAQSLILSVRTVDAHLRSIFAKLGVHSRTEAALWIVKHGDTLEK